VYQVRGYGVLERLRRSRLYGRVAPYVPATLRRFGYGFAVRGVRPANVPVAEVQDYLRSHQRPQTDELSALLNRRFPEWTTLHGELASQLAQVSNSRYF